jgi:hypothetical protein
MGFTEWKCLFVCDVIGFMKDMDKENKRTQKWKSQRFDTQTVTSSVAAVPSIVSERRDDAFQYHPDAILIDEPPAVPVPQEKPVDMYPQELDESLLELASDRMEFRRSAQPNSFPSERQRTPSPDRSFTKPFSIQASPISKKVYNPQQYVQVERQSPNRSSFHSTPQATPTYAPPTPSNMQIQVLELCERMKDLETELHNSRRDHVELRAVYLIYKAFESVVAKLKAAEERIVVLESSSRRSYTTSLNGFDINRSAIVDTDSLVTFFD